METKLVAFFAMCFFLCLPAAYAQNKPPSKEIEISSRKLLLPEGAPGPVLPAAHDGATEHRRLSPSLGDSLAPRLLILTLASLCVIVAGILCRLRAQNPQIHSADETVTVRPNITCNFIGSCISVN